MRKLSNFNIYNKQPLENIINLKKNPIRIRKGAMELKDLIFLRRKDFISDKIEQCLFFNHLLIKQIIIKKKGTISSTC